MHKNLEICSLLINKSNPKLINLSLKTEDVFTVDLTYGEWYSRAPLTTPLHSLVIQ